MTDKQSPKQPHSAEFIKWHVGFEDRHHAWNDELSIMDDAGNVLAKINNSEFGKRIAEDIVREHNARADLVTMVGQNKAVILSYNDEEP